MREQRDLTWKNEVCVCVWGVGKWNCVCVCVRQEVIVMSVRELLSVISALSMELCMNLSILLFHLERGHIHTHYGGAIYRILAIISQ